MILISKILGIRSGFSVPLGYGATSLGALCNTFRDHYAVSKRRELITQYRVATSHSDGEEN